MRKKIFLMALLLLISGRCFAGIFSRNDAGTTGATFLKIEAGARPVAMGGAFVAVADDANATYWNPAGLVQIRQREITAMHNEWFQEIRYDFLSYAHPLRESDVLGGSVTCLYLGNMEKRMTEEEEPSSFGAFDLAVAMVYAHNFNDSFSGGANLKLIHQKIEDEKAWGVALDVGGLTKIQVVGHKLWLGLAVQNIGPKIKFVREGDPLPLNIKFGIAYRSDIESRKHLVQNRIIFAFDINAPIDNKVNAHVGLEYVYTRWRDMEFALRMGYKTNNLKDLGVLSGFSAGLGFIWKGLGVDYAWVPYGDLGNTHRVSLSGRF